MAGNGRKNARALAIAALAAGQTRADAAKHAGVTETTLYRWLGDAGFGQALREQQAEMLARVAAQLADVATTAVQRLRSLLDAESESVRLGAVRTALEFTGRWRETVELEERLTALEAGAGLTA